MGVLRIHFTAEDLARTRVLGVVDSMWEVALGQFRLRRPVELPFRRWAADVRRGPGLPRQPVELMRAVLPKGSYFPDFLTPPGAGRELEAGLEALLSTPRQRLRQDMTRLAGAASAPDWLRPLAEGDVPMLRRLADAVRAYHDVLVAPWRSRIEGAVAADRARRAQAWAEGGVEGMFASLPPGMRWRFPVLEVDYPETRDFVLGGRGITLVPSYFCFHRAVSFADPSVRPQLIYPVDQELRWSTAGRTGSSLDTLVGATRAKVMRVVDCGVTTTQLAERAGTTVPSASRHAAVLRSAGLVTSVRHHNAVYHTTTPLGRSLLEADR